MGSRVAIAVFPLLVSATFLLYFHHKHPADAGAEDLNRLRQPEPLADLSTSMTSSMEVNGVKIERNPPESKLTALDVTSWPKWECSPSKFPWTFATKETMYLLQGKVKVYCEGYDGFFEIGAGDLVEFPKGMKVTWDVIEAVSKHYSLDK